MYAYHQCQFFFNKKSFWRSQVIQVGGCFVSCIYVRRGNVLTYFGEARLSWFLDYTLHGTCPRRHKLLLFCWQKKDMKFWPLWVYRDIHRHVRGTYTSPFDLIFFSLIFQRGKYNFCKVVRREENTSWFSVSSSNLFHFRNLFLRWLLCVISGVSS